MNKRMRSLATLLAALVSFTLIFSAMPAVALAAAGDTGVTDIWNWTELPDGTLEINMPTAPFSGSYTLPDQLDIGQPGTPDIRDVTQIGSNAFMGSTGLTAMTLPSTLKVIGPYAFDHCTALTSITIPDSVASIGENAFFSCTGLLTVTLPDNSHSNLTSISRYAFSNCPGLTSIVIPDTVTSIGASAFGTCRNLVSITLPNNPAFTAISDNLFDGCQSLSSLVIPASVTSIGDSAFSATGFTSITIPANVSSIGQMVFTPCLHLTSIQVDPANTNFVSDGGVLYNADETSLLACPGAKAGTFVVPTGVTDIASGAFVYCQNLTGVTLADGVKTIGASAFAFSGIKSITIPRSVTDIGPMAFSFCASLKKAVFLNKNTTLGNMMFYGAGIVDGIYGFDGSTAQTYAATNYPTDNLFHILYTVTFQTSGGSAVDETYVETGHTFAAPTAPTKSGVTFSGWYADSGLTDAWDFSTDTVTADMTLYAAWAAPTLTPTPTPTPTPTATATASPTATPSPMATPSPSPTAAATSTTTPALQITTPSGDDNIYTGGRITITPSIEGGTWSYDSSFLSRDGNTFKGLKVGTVRVTYTVGSQTTYVDIVITQAEIPQTGQDFSPALWVLALAVSAGVAALILAGRRRKLQG